ncbi:MAG TPA: ABC transporter ATP-binding protein [Candidatus Avacidaminococcus intestinavium]|uniref:ABC transporter ATP-binding protein n=1 Tax=Candidatus Avacidaminococcus intestinavium TaxID=2840684 RepID=A0A9D1MPX9_9FIRM|nr:ABC transporter ATP-binding protein [Candidatus Avacidaminococcus intestinavium]
MSEIEFIDVVKSYGNTNIIPKLTLKIKAGERLVLLGPSGCGKTTTLRMIAGFEEVTAGKLVMGGERVNEVPPGERNVAMVFQNYALYPHMTVWENISFGLQIQSLPQVEIKARVSEALQVLNLVGYETRKPSELSGGQKQRVALGRAIVKQAPYFLLDEPLSNLDAQLRQQARTELVKLHELYKPTMIYVTHDQVEAMTIAQRIAILNKGVLQQLDTPETIYHRPANTFVASFIGTPAMNLLEVYIKDGRLFVGEACLTIGGGWEKLTAGHNKLIMGLRPEKCHLGEGENFIGGQITYAENMGSYHTVRFDVKNGGEIYLTTDCYQSGKNYQGCSFAWQDLSFFDYRTGENIGYPV